MSLEPIDPETALELYLADKANELADASLTSHEYRLNHSVRWCRERELENLNEPSGRKFHKYRLWRREEDDLLSEQENADGHPPCVRPVVGVNRWRRTGYLREGPLPAVTPDENSRDIMLFVEQANEILAHCEKYAYTSIEYVALSLMWHTMTRTGAVHALDVEDYHTEDQYLEIRHRPETDTSIRNKNDGERLVALSEQLCNLLDEWLETQRPSVTDDYGRNPRTRDNLWPSSKRDASRVCLSPHPSLYLNKRVPVTETQRIVRQWGRSLQLLVRRARARTQFAEVASRTA